MVVERRKPPLAGAARRVERSNSTRPLVPPCSFAELQAGVAGRGPRQRAQRRSGGSFGRVGGVGPGFATRGGVPPVQLELEAEIRLGRLREGRSLRGHGHRETLRVLEQRGGNERRRHRVGRVVVRRDVHDETVALERRVFRGEPPDKTRDRRELRFGRLDLLRLGCGGGRRKDEGSGQATGKGEPVHGADSTIPGAGRQAGRPRSPGPGEAAGGEATLSTRRGCGRLRRMNENDRVWRGWGPGEFQAHFIHTGVAESVFFVFPDSTTCCSTAATRRRSRPDRFAVRACRARAARRRMGRPLRPPREPQRRRGRLGRRLHFHSDHVGTPSWQKFPWFPDEPDRLEGCPRCGFALAARRSVPPRDGPRPGRTSTTIRCRARARRRVGVVALHLGGAAAPRQARPRTLPARRTSSPPRKPVARPLLRPQRFARTAGAAGRLRARPTPTSSPATDPPRSRTE